MASQKAFLTSGLTLRDTPLVVFLPRNSRKFSPTVHDPRRAPDVLVIVGSDYHYRHQSRIKDGPFSRLQSQSIRGTLEKLSLRPSPIPGITEFIGKTRVILVPTEMGV